MSLAKIITNNSVTFFSDGEAYTADKSHPNFNEIKEALVFGDAEGAIDLLDIPKAIVTASEGKVEVRNGHVYWDKEELHGYVVDRILEFMSEGQEVTYLISFVDRLMQNPSRRAVKELYAFLEHMQMPIDEDGFFYSYKGVKDNYYSQSSGGEVLVKGKRQGDYGPIFNGIGEEIRLNRHDVCDDANIGCSNGLHVGSLQYATHWGTRTVIVKVDPADVVSVPHDCSHQKLRTCAYSVVADYDGPLGNYTCQKDLPYDEVSEDLDDYDYDYE